MTDTNEFVSIEDVAKHFTVSVSTARAWVRQGEIPKNTYVKIGKTYRFKLDAVVAAASADIPKATLLAPVVLAVKA